MAESSFYLHESVTDADRQPHHDGLGLNDLITIRKSSKDLGNGHAAHCYTFFMEISETERSRELCAPGQVGERVGALRFQHGPRNERDSMPGLTNEAVVAVVLDRLRDFQCGPFKCRENAIAITKLEEALLWMDKRARTRHKQGVLGKNEKHK